MTRLIVMFLLFLAVSAVSDAIADELSDNPAFCAGFLAMQSDRHAAMMRTHETKIIRAFNAAGPKDSTDGRGFSEWVQIGADAAAEKSPPDYDLTLLRCRDLIEDIIQ